MFTNKFTKVFTNLLLLILSAFLFALPNPGFIFSKGAPIIAWFAYIPLFILVNRISCKTSWIYGFFYGVLCYCFYVFWMVTFHPLGIFAVSIEHGVFLIPTFLCMSFAKKLFNKHGWILQFIILVAYEYLKTCGYGGFNYGVTGYTQYKYPMICQIANIAGVWSLSALIVFVSAWISKVIIDFNNYDKNINQSKIERIRNVIDNHKISALIWIVCFIFTLVYGKINMKDYSSYSKVKIAAVQNNTDPWNGNIEVYKRDVKNLIKLSEKAILENPDIEIVVWPETSVVPAIIQNYNERFDSERFNLVDGLLKYINQQKQIFVIGNDHKVNKDDYNSVLVFRPQENVIPPKPEMYQKIHLVPFTEYFPLQNQLPDLYQKLIDTGSHFWIPGKKNTVFYYKDLRFCTPVCFEDTFGKSVRDMYNSGARAIINLSNDAWSKSVACQYQHLAMATFRSIEFKIPSVRSTASGQTCFIDPNGSIIAMSEPFQENYIINEIPIIPSNSKNTIYSKIGDLFGQLIALIALFWLLLGVFLKVKNRR